jgi:sugar/nucleoside kinase (ribokinase family)
MTPAPPSGDLDLLVVGALTVDHFADGSAAPGGTVLHAVRAAAAAGYRVGAVTVAGPEPAARDGVAELQRLTGALEVRSDSRSVTFTHTEHEGRRRLVLDAAPPQPIHVPSPPPASRAVLFGPVAGELPPSAAAVAPGVLRGATIQGWLRRLEPGEPVTPLALDSLGAVLRRALSELDLVVASSEDLAAVADDSRGQLAALRAALGERPVLVMTAGASGLWLSSGSDERLLAAPRVVTGRPTVGAGDMLAALILVAPSGGDVQQAARRAMEHVAIALERRPLLRPPS